MKKFLSLSLMFLGVTKASASFPELAEDFVHIFDINGTVMLADAATGKTTEQAMYQVVAEQIVLTNGNNAEQQLKAEITDKPVRNKHYPNLLDQLVTWQETGLTTGAHIESAREYIAKAEEALKATEPYNGIFPSFINYLNAAVGKNPEAVILLHSFGHETDHVRGVVKEHGPKMVVSDDTLTFTEEGHLQNEGFTYKLTSTFELLLLPGLRAWQANHVGWKKGTGGKVVWKDKSILFDDNADICALPIVDDEFKPEAAKSMMGREIHKVNTYKALVDPDYFINALKAGFQ